MCISDANEVVRSESFTMWTNPTVCVQMKNFIFKWMKFIQIEFFIFAKLICKMNLLAFGACCCLFQTFASSCVWMSIIWNGLDSSVYRYHNIKNHNKMFIAAFHCMVNAQATTCIAFQPNTAKVVFNVSNRLLYSYTWMCVCVYRE